MLFPGRGSAIPGFFPAVGKEIFDEEPIADLSDSIIEPMLMRMVKLRKHSDEIRARFKNGLLDFNRVP